MRILVIGAGMYVTGRFQTGSGTILASLIEASKFVHIEKVVIVARNMANEKIVAERSKELNSLLRANLPVTYKALPEDFEQSLRKEIAENGYDAAIISVPDHLHFLHASIALELGLHILVVKPLVPTLMEAKSLETLRKQKNLHAMVEFHKRFDETNLWIKKYLSNNELGKLLFIDVDYSQKVSIPTEIFRSWVEKTNIFQYLGVHYVDLIYFVTGFLPTRAMAIGTSGKLKKLGINNYDSVHAEVVWQKPNDPNDSFVSHFSIGWVDPISTTALSDQKYLLVGEKGRIECDQKDRGLRIVNENTGPLTINPYFSEMLPDRDGNLSFGGYGYRSIECFLKDVSDILNGRKTAQEFDNIRPSIKQSFVSTRVVEAVNESLANDSSWSTINDIFE
ncbi:MAG TPA: Gfo/Idh/MocA family oxidoreductase [Candidatus Rifleibacterium sp.]|nr:Gfo/Idh/MocA family oxidoreductase [Candidatus Rifleibacterium sp.]HPT47525.1 Gfo/Idh/MocA family oxidoreductase [Candidatus Rifleibacterium sp.]